MPPKPKLNSVSGPKQTIVARRKERVLGIWTNTDSRNFINVPSYLALLSTRPTDQFATPDQIRQMQLNLDSFLLPQQIAPDIGDPGPKDPFRMNFVRLKITGSIRRKPTR